MRGYIKRVEDDCPFLYEVAIMHIDKPISKEEWKKMEKVEKKRIGTRKYLLKK